MDEKGKKSRKLSECETVQLLMLYRDCECLWNYASKDYKNKNKRNECYENIRKELKLGSECEVKRKIKSIRDTFTAEKNKIKKSFKSGAGTDDVYETKLSWYNLASSFLLNSGGRPSCNNLSTESFEDDISQSECFIEATSSVRNELNSDVSSCNEKNNKPEDVVDTDVCCDLITRQSKKEGEVKCQNLKKRRINKGDMSESIDTAIKKLQQLKKDTNQDEFYYFGQGIACQLRALPKECAAQLQADIQNLVTQKKLEFLSKMSRNERCSTSLSTYSCNSFETSCSSKEDASKTPDLLEEAISITFDDTFFETADTENYSYN